MITILYFAACREAASTSSDELAGPTTVGEVLKSVGERHPALRAILPRCRVAVNQAFAAAPADLVPDGAEVALIPPVAGG